MVRRLFGDKGSSLGGIAGDWIGNRWGLIGRSGLLGLTILFEGLLMVLFSTLKVLGPATVAFPLFGLFMCLACGVPLAVVPSIRPRAVGSASGIVGAGGNFAADLLRCFSSPKALWRQPIFDSGQPCSGDFVRCTGVALWPSQG